jgi:hypothetical protein
MTTTEITTWEQWREWFQALPPLSRGLIQAKAVEEALADWPEECGFGSSDRNHATFAFCVGLGVEGIEREFGETIALERRLIAQDFDFETGRQMFAPAD